MVVVGEAGARIKISLTLHQQHGTGDWHNYPDIEHGPGLSV